MMSDQLKADAGSAPSSPSLALPAKLIWSPTFQSSDPAGLVIKGVGGVLSTEMGIDATSDNP